MGSLNAQLYFGDPGWDNLPLGEDILPSALARIILHLLKQF
jgi:hypothetical protein